MDNSLDVKKGKQADLAGEINLAMRECGKSHKALDDAKTPGELFEMLKSGEITESAYKNGLDLYDRLKIEYNNDKDVLYALRKELTELSNEIERIEKKERMNPVKNILAVLSAWIVFVVAWILISTVVGFIANIPIIGPLLYWPSGSSWARTVLTVTTSVFAGGYVSTKICGHAKVFSVLICILYIADLICMFAYRNFSWNGVLTDGLCILTAIICFGLKNDQK